MSSQQYEKIHLKTWKIPPPTESTKNSRHKNNFCVTWNCLLYLNTPGQILQDERRSESMIFRSNDAILTSLKKNQKD